MAGNGGARPGSGRKPKANKYAGPIAAAEDRIKDRLPDLIDNLFALADGVTVDEPMPHGGSKVYCRPPNREANEYLINRIMGKVPDRIAGHDGGPLFDLRSVLAVLTTNDLDSLESIADKIAGGAGSQASDPGGAVVPEPD